MPGGAGCPSRRIDLRTHDPQKPDVQIRDVPTCRSACGEPRARWRRTAAAVVLGISCALPLAAAFTVPARAAEVVDVAAGEKLGWFGEDWYGVFCDEHRVGWMRRSLTKGKFEERETVVREVELRLDVAGDGNHVVTVTRSTFAADDPQLLLSVATVQAEGTRSTVREVFRRGERFDVVTTRSGRSVPGAVPSFVVVLADELGFERVVRAPASPLVVSSIDLGTLQQGHRTFTAAADAARPGEFDVTVTAGSAKETAHVGADGRVISGSLGSRFSFRRETEAVAKDPAYRVTLEKLSRIPLVSADGGAEAPARLGDPNSIQKLVVAWDDPKSRVFVASPRQVLTRDGTSLRITVDIDAEGARADDAATEEALRDEPGLDVDSAAVREIVTKILSGTAGRAVQAQAIVDAVFARMKKEIVVGTPTVLEILSDARGDCSEHARLCVALCRAAGIPARIVDGIKWTGDDTSTFGWHSWVEVEVAGRWLAVDPTDGANPAPATCIAIERSPEARTLLWGAKLRLVSLERRPAPARNDRQGK